LSNLYFINLQNSKSVWLRKYLNLIYKDTSKISIKNLNFYYACYPKKILEYYGKLYNSHENNYNPPPKGKLWTPIWFPKDAVAVNNYDPNNWWEYKTNKKNWIEIIRSNYSPSNKWIEVIHTPDDNPYYPVVGYWVYQTTGSGVFMNVGKTLISPNKISSLYKLGYNVNQIANIIKDTKYMNNINENYSNVNDIAIKMYPNIDLIKSLEKIVTNILEGSKKYLIDRINNSADWDKIIVETANKKGYDSVQFTIQANGMGGWAHEIVFTGMDVQYLNKNVEKSWKGWSWIQSRLRNGLETNDICTFNPNEKYEIVTCQEQQVTYKLNCIKSNIKTPNYD
jgi:hypothetical protein